MKSGKFTRLLSLSTFGIMLLMSIAATPAISSPSMRGDHWSVSAGWEFEVGLGRDPGHRDTGMAGAAAGPSLGVQYWLKDWFAAEGMFLVQTDHDTGGPFSYESSAWRVAAGLRLASPTVLSPHLSLGIGYDRFQSDWSVLSDAAEPSGKGTDQLSSLVGTSELGLTLHVDGWSLGAHLGFVMYFGADAEATVSAWSDSNTAQGGPTRSSVTDWASGPLNGGNINIGLRVARSF